MVHLIVGKEGKGKTKILLAKANDDVKQANGNSVYLDMSSHHMYELNNKIRLIDVSTYPITNSEQLKGFFCGIISQDRDIQYMYFDGLLKLPEVHEGIVPDTIEALDSICSQYDIDLTLSVSMDKDDLGDKLQKMIQVSL